MGPTDKVSASGNSFYLNIQIEYGLLNVEFSIKKTGPWISSGIVIVIKQYCCISFRSLVCSENCCANGHNKNTIYGTKQGAHNTDNVYGVSI
jgi:hypothetical protein